MRYRPFIIATFVALAPGLALADKCKPDCGRISQIDPYEKGGEGSGVGAVAGGVAGALLGNQIGHGTGKTVATVGGAAGGAYLGNVIEKKAKTEKRLKVTIALDNGKSKVMDIRDKGAFAKGDRVQLVDGKLHKYTGQ